MQDIVLFLGEAYSLVRDSDPELIYMKGRAPEFLQLDPVFEVFVLCRAASQRHDNFD